MKERGEWGWFWCVCDGFLQVVDGRGHLLSVLGVHFARVLDCRWAI